MISPWLMYLYSICVGLNLVACILLFITFITLWISAESGGENLNRWHRNVCIVIFIISILIIILVPGKTEMLAIIASTIITPDNFPTDINTYLQELVKACGEVK